MLDLAIAGVTVGALIFGIVEAAKEFGVSGQGSRIMVLVLGCLFVGYGYASGQGIIPDAARVWVDLVVTAVAGGVAAMGYYDHNKRNGL